MTNNPWRYWQVRVETPEETRARADAMERLLSALAVHGGLIADLAEIADFIQGRRQRGAVCAFRRKVWDARAYFMDEAKAQRRKHWGEPRQAAAKRQAARKD